DGLTHRLAADGAADDFLHIGDVEAEAGGGGAVDVHVQVTTAREAFGERRGDAGRALGDRLHLGCDPVELGKVGSGDLHPDGALDAGRQHVDPVADGRDPDVGEAGDLD